MTWISKIKKYKRLDKRKGKVYNFTLLASKNIFLAYLCFYSFLFPFLLSWRTNLFFDTIGDTIYTIL